ncbi:hypothetical protein BS78_06G155500 [Paspalum vaginatum]|nr:hypothetical protein BS78_06G155500 [Paspalum vaginatum]
MSPAGIDVLEILLRELNLKERLVSRPYAPGEIPVPSHGGQRRNIRRVFIVAAVAVYGRDADLPQALRGARLSRPPLRQRGSRGQPARALGDDLLDLVVAGVLLYAGVAPGEDAEPAEHGRRHGRHEAVNLDDLADAEAIGEDEVVVVGVEGHVAGACRVGEAEEKPWLPEKGSAPESAGVMLVTWSPGAGHIHGGGSAIASAALGRNRHRQTGPAGGAAAAGCPAGATACVATRAEKERNETTTVSAAAPFAEDGRGERNRAGVKCATVRGGGRVAELDLWQVFSPAIRRSKPLLNTHKRKNIALILDIIMVTTWFASYKLTTFETSSNQRNISHF